MSDFIAGAVATVALMLLAWWIVIGAGTALWHDALAIHRLLAGM